MSVQPAYVLDRLFTPGARLGWVFRDPHRMTAPFPEPEPDPEHVPRLQFDRLLGAHPQEAKALLPRLQSSLPGSVKVATGGVLSGVFSLPLTGTAVAATAGARAWVGYVRHQVAVTERSDALHTDTTAMAFDLDAGLYWRPEEGGFLFGMSNPKEPPGPGRSIDWPYLRSMQRRLHRFVPATRGLGLKKAWAATIEYTPDHLPIIGPVVLGDGTVVRLGGKAVEDEGYDLVGAFVGSEGTLGLVTEMTVKLTPLPEDKRTLMAAFPTMDEASETVSAMKATASSGPPSPGRSSVGER